MPAGRPTEYSEEIAKTICERLASADSLVGICQASDMPSYTTVWNWKQKYPEFVNNLARAREEAADFMSHEIKEIADTQEIGEVVTLKADGTEERKVADMIDHRKLRIDTRVKLMQMLKPKTYAKQPGDSADNPLHGAIQIVSTIPRPPRDTE